MQLKSLAIRKLHGALNLDINFRDDFTFLVGINGSGKTSIVNCIEILLRPDFPKLATLDYEMLSLSFIFEERSYQLIAKKNTKQVKLSVICGENKFSPITIDLIHGVADEEAVEIYGRLGPDDKERPMYNFIKSLPNPIVITLDRTIIAESEDTLFLENNRSRLVRRGRMVTNPLDHVHEVTSSAYAAYRRQAIAADEKLKSEIVISAFQKTDIFSGSQKNKLLTDIQIKNLENKVISFLSKTVKTGDVENQVRDFFRTARLTAARDVPNTEKTIINLIIGSRYHQIDSLATAFNAYELASAKAFSMLSNYLVTINSFFKDSNKELFFDESTGQLVFSFIENGQRNNVRREIKHLSSGERQILILFTFLAFSAKTSATFIVDEPELSLHPKWQHEFMDAFLKLKPEKSQVLIATHSPEIVGKYKHACIPIRQKLEGK